MTTITYINGEPGDKISITDRGFMYGDGLFETILACDAKMPLWDHHYERLASDCQRLSIPAPSEHALRQQIDPHLNKANHQIIKIVVTRGEGQRGYRVMQPISPNVVITLSERTFQSPFYWKDGIAVYCCATRFSHQPALAGIKHLNRLEQVLASQEWDGDYREGLMCTRDDDVIEATSHNLFFIKDGHILTPDLSLAGVSGVMRRYVIELASEMQMPVYIQKMKLADIPSMDEVFLTNSIDGIWPVRRVGEWSFNCGEITRMLQTRVAQLLPYQ